MQTSLKRSSLKRLGRAAGALGVLAGLGAYSGPAYPTTAYVTNEKGNSISVIDVDKLEVTRTVKIGQRPRGIALSKDDALMFVCLGDDDTIAIIDTKARLEHLIFASG